MPIYNKLVRDLIPAIIEKDGKALKARNLSEEEYVTELNKKMHEELKEYEEAENQKQAVEELADLLELIYAAVRVHGSSVEELETIRKKKAEKRGGFDERIFLIEVEDE